MPLQYSHSKIHWSCIRLASFPAAGSSLLPRNNYTCIWPLTCPVREKKGIYWCVSIGVSIGVSFHLCLFLVPGLLNFVALILILQKQQCSCGTVSLLLFRWVNGHTWNCVRREEPGNEATLDRTMTMTVMFLMQCSTTL